jgi:Ca-activated chloride channel family protein
MRVLVPRRAAYAVAVIGVACSIAPAQRIERVADTSPTVALRRDMVTFSVTVLDVDGRCVSGLDKTTFQIYDDRVRQDIAFFTDDDLPLTVGIVFDVSGSMEAKMDQAGRALGALLERSHRDDDIFALGVANGVTLLQDFTANVPSIASAFVLSSAHGRTSLYDGVYAAVNKCRQGRNARRAVVVVSDGQDNWSRYTFGELADLLKEADVAVYAVGITDFEHDGILGYDGARTLRNMARLTGGEAYFPLTDQGIFDACVAIAIRLRRQYSIGYYPSNATRDGKWHDVKVKLARNGDGPKLAVMHRGGYYAPAR